MILSALRPLTCNSTWPQHTLQMFADHCGPRQTIPWETINQGLLQPQGELYPIQTIFNHRSRDQLLKFCTSFYETISSEFRVQGNFKHTQFSREHWNWPDSNSQPLAPKMSAVSIELNWLFWQYLNCCCTPFIYFYSFKPWEMNFLFSISEILWGYLRKIFGNYQRNPTFLSNVSDKEDNTFYIFLNG